MLPLYNLIARAGKYQFLGKNNHPIHPFFIHKHPYRTQMKIYIYSTPHLYYNPRPCPPILLLINYIFSWKSQVKHKRVDITWFYSKSSLTKYKKYLLEAFYGTSETPVRQWVETSLGNGGSSCLCHHDTLRDSTHSHWLWSTRNFRGTLSFLLPLDSFLVKIKSIHR